MDRKVDIILNLIKESFNLDEIKDYDLDKIKLIIKILDIKEDSKIINLGSGTYSNVYKIGDKVLKIGLAKLDLTIIKHKRIIEVYLKTNIEIKTENNNMDVGIEIQKIAEIVKGSKDDLYKIYKELRDDGIIWQDVKESNVGLSNNNLVVIDTDFLSFESKKMSNCLNVLDDEFEKLYNDNKED